MIKEIHTLPEIVSCLAGEKEVFVVYDKNAARVAGELSWPSIAIDTSEELKVMDTVVDICRALMEAGASRKALLLAVGGGITTDLAGFAASIYKRGIRYANVPTTLLAQVDAAIGGKTGVNLDGYKNMLGAFHMPEFTFIWAPCLRTLPAREFLAGAAEMLKTFLLADAAAYNAAVRLFSLPKSAENDDKLGDFGSSSSKMAENDDELGNFGSSLPKSAENDDELGALIARAAQIKAAVVQRDPFEQGERALLNLGHSFGHAIEHEAGEKGADIHHGEAVAMGIIMAARLSEAIGLAQEGLAEKIRADFHAIGLPTETPYPPQALAKAMEKDKKGEGGKLKFILLKAIGEPCIMEMTPGQAMEKLQGK